MPTSTLDQKLTESRSKLEQKYIFPATIGLLVVLIVMWAGAKRFSSDDYWMNLLTEGLGIAITILIIDRLNEYREERQLKKRLIREAGSQSNETAKLAVDWMRSEKWLTGDASILPHSNLDGANLAGANLVGVNLNSCTLVLANLEGADLGGANFKDCTLFSTNMRRTEQLTRLSKHVSGASSLKNLQSLKTIEPLEFLYFNPTIRIKYTSKINFSNAKFFDVDLSNSDFENADFENAVLCNVELSGTDLSKCNMRNATLINPQFSDKTILPDGKHWTPDTDMRKYTDPTHEDFSLPHWVKLQK